MATEKLIHASFEETENLEAVISSPDNPLLLCQDHYNEAYRKFHPQTVCASCGAIPKSKTSFSSHNPDADLSLFTCEIDLVPTILYSQQITCVPHVINYILV